MARQARYNSSGIPALIAAPRNSRSRNYLQSPLAEKDEPGQLTMYCIKCDGVIPVKSRSVNTAKMWQYSLSRPSAFSTRRMTGVALITMLAIGACSDKGSSVATSVGGDDNTAEGTSTPAGGGTTGDDTTGDDTTGNTGDNAELPVLNAASGDDFSVDSLEQWSLRHQTEATNAQYTVLDINQTTTGALTIQPTLTPGWFAANDAPLVYRLVSGNFAVEAAVTATSATDPTLPPQSEFNSAGLMARNPAGATGPENYVMVNIGRLPTLY